jgi:hypothetical protein
MYIGRGAYCGLVVDRDGNAVTALSTICTALNDATPNLGARWMPPADAAIRAAQYKAAADATTWGFIGSAALQNDLAQQGMRFYRGDERVQPTAFQVGTDIAGYTHGMVRAIYEITRMGEGTAFEMSIGSDTFKLASCASCSSFMMANDLEASSTHLGRGESWVPYYSGVSHNPSHHGDATTLDMAIDGCNGRHAEFMHECLTAGVRALQRSRAWVCDSHLDALDKLEEALRRSTGRNTVARDLFLDAMTVHKSDAQRVDDMLRYGPNPRPRCDGTFDWCMNRPLRPDIKGIWETFENPFTDRQLAELHHGGQVYRIEVWSPYRGDSCALPYSLLNADGKEVDAGRLAQGPEEETGSADFVVPVPQTVDTWQIKVGDSGGYNRIVLNQNTAVGSGDRYAYTVSKV